MASLWPLATSDVESSLSYCIRDCHVRQARPWSRLHCEFVDTPSWKSVVSRACVDQLLIAIRSMAVVCDHVWSATRPISVTFNSWTRDTLPWTLSVSRHLGHAAPTTVYRHGTGRGWGRWAVESVAAAACLRAVHCRSVGVLAAVGLRCLLQQQSKWEREGGKEDEWLVSGNSRRVWLEPAALPAIGRPTIRPR